ncbi:MAG: hypothetical protein A2Y40_05685 [Candidatus Margulisbacteria bacterium GWF2_35_9]|nr:MAG: hypothetical protein A2Y40_05685 [Candidatus Margulisbacteria bacterium GWF2_35_9]
MINLFTYLSFTNISIGQLYQHFIIALLAIIVLYSTYFSLKKLPSSIQVKDSFYMLLIGFVILILNIGLFFIFIYLAKHSVFVLASWFPIFGIVVHTVTIAAHTVLSTATLVPILSHKKVKRIAWIYILFYLVVLASIIGLFLAPVTTKWVYKFWLKTNQADMFIDLIFIISASVLLIKSKFKSNPFLNVAILSLVIASGYHVITILYPVAIKYLIVNNFLTIFAYIFIEIFVFFEIIKETSDARNEVEKMNDDLEVKIKDRTSELHNSNKELFHTNYMLHQEKEKLDAIIENLDEGIIVSNISHSILMINSSAKELLDIKDNVVGSNIGDILPDKEYVQDINKIILKKVRKVTKEIHINKENKSKVSIHIKSSLSTDSKGNIIGIITLIRNITKEIEIEQLKAGFLKSISHELKTPLTTIIGFSETLDSERRGKLNTDQKEYVGIINKESQHLNKLINDLLEFSKLTSNKITLSLGEVSLKSIISHVVDSFRPQAELKNIEIIFEDVLNLPTIQADRDKIYTVFVNIISNAITFTDEGSITISFATMTNKIITKITDTGVGIEEENINKIFDTFMHIKKKNNEEYHSGLGLGLSIARDLVMLHDGNIWAESTVESGSSFYVELPISH